MSTSILRKIRIAVSLIFFIAFSFVFLDFRRLIPEEVINGITWLQFIPSVLKFINVLSISAIGFLVVIVLTLLFGRVYCSSVCPLGILQDIINWFSKKFKKKKNRYFKTTKPHNKLRYGILILSILSFVFGIVFFINLFDPYSNFGRIFTFFIKPVVILVNNLLAFFLGKFNVYTLFPVEIKLGPALVILIQFAILGLVVWMSAFHGRLFCNTICPVGTFLGFLSKFSLFRIRIDHSTCTSCSLCGMVCKASCLNTKDQSLDVSRCISCFDCLTVCKSNSVRYSAIKSITEKTINEGDNKEDIKPDVGKRKFIVGSIAFALGTVGISRAQEVPTATKDLPDQSQEVNIEDQDLPAKIIPKNSKPTEVREARDYPVCPPGSTSIEKYNESCTACNLCVSACPNDVLHPAFLEYGLIGLMQPRMDYWKGFCNFECTRCLDVCPTGAILPLEVDTKKLTQLGIAKFIKDNCIVHTDKTDCGACSEHCPTKAVKMVPYKETALVIPEVEDEICIGCGACEFACPTTPYKAIFVNGNYEHKLADKPKEEKIIMPSTEEDFPF